jgi:hypothetical protein
VQRREQQRAASPNRSRAIDHVAPEIFEAGEPPEIQRLLGDARHVPEWNRVAAGLHHLAMERELLLEVGVQTAAATKLQPESAHW